MMGVEAVFFQTNPGAIGCEEGAGCRQETVLERYYAQGLKYFFEKYTARAELVLGAPTFAAISPKEEDSISPLSFELPFYFHSCRTSIGNNCHPIRKFYAQA
jgi:hypothetical protein